ncbi:MAG: exodeoxyribonuclease VII small subunit [Gammaproteobacteria bacterium HGW-Gammaproteobacteria-14]|nr:MAG: exodeoxyribonuclease VII small subunit [Gammaproteobacteria bacterium HGW-Gammaproteobacteria-14]
MARKPNSANLEQSLDTLETLVERMESGELSLEESLKAFEEGVKLTRECQQALRAAEQKVKILLSADDEPTPFTTSDAADDATDDK